MYKDENQHSDQTLVLSLNISDQLSEIRRSQNSVASIQSEDQHKPRTSDGSLKSVLLEDENNLLTNQNEEQQNVENNGKANNKNNDNDNKNNQHKVVAVEVAQQGTQQTDNAVAGAVVLVDELSNEIVNGDGEEEDGDDVEVEVEEENDDEEDQNRVIDVGTAGVNDNTNH